MLVIIYAQSLLFGLFGSKFVLSQKLLYGIEKSLIFVRFKKVHFYQKMAKSKNGVLGNYLM